jgi:hypothetical protein
MRELSWMNQERIELLVAVHGVLCAIKPRNSNQYCLFSTNIIGILN